MHCLTIRLCGSIASGDFEVGRRPYLSITKLLRFRAIAKVLCVVKFRTWSETPEDLWLDRWKNPLTRTIHIADPDAFMNDLGQPLNGGTDRSVLLATDLHLLC